MTVSPVPPSVDMTVMCTSGVVPMSTQPPVVTSVPAMSTATITSWEIDLRSDVDPVPRLGPASSSCCALFDVVVWPTSGSFGGGEYASR